eukprot:CFRG8324T1
MHKPGWFACGCLTGLVLLRCYHLRRLHSNQAKDDDDPESFPSLAERGQVFSYSSQTPLGEVDINNKESQNLLNLLYTIAEDQARQEGYVHRGLTCNSCNVSDIRGVRYKCANCADFDLCELCEAHDQHDSTHVMVKIRIPIPPLANPRHSLLPVLYPGGNQNKQMHLSKDAILRLQKRTHFDQVELEALFEQFKSLSRDGGIDKTTFEQCLGPLGVDRNLVTERIFHFFDQDGSGSIDFRELVCGLSVLCKGSQEEKIEYAFKGYDLDNSGFITRDELREMFKAYFYLSMELVRDVVKALEEEMMANFNDEGGKPVSAVFTAPIPRDATDPPVEKSDTDTIEDPFNIYGAAVEEGRAGSVSFSPESPDTAEYSSFPANASSSSTALASNKNQENCSEHTDVQNVGSSSLTSIHQNSSSRGTSPTPHAPTPNHSTPISVIRQTSQPYPHPPRRSGSIDRSIGLQGGLLSRSGAMGVLSSRAADGTDMWPVMEAMSRSAIEEMVENAFKSADLDHDGTISFEEFKKWAQTDMSMIAWFEALGSVF